jgi:response regulator of citrate/malate metabolism
MSWWSRTYNRPLKDPILQSYTLEELYYEYRDKIERELASKETSEQEDDKIEQEKIDNALAWAEAEEEKERQQMSQNQGVSEEDMKWMKTQMEKAKEQFGEDFGEDIDEEF